MHFLIVNDDGITSPFLPILTQAVKRAGHRVTVCVPATQQSAKAHAFSIEQPILAEKREVPDADEAWAIFGTPVDSCRIGAMNLAPDADAVISGINLGYNVGMSVYVSGTVGAAREATFLRKPGIAVSAEKQTPHDTLAYLSDCRRDGGEAGHARRAGTDGVQPERAADSPCGAEKSGAVPAEPRRLPRQLRAAHQSAQADVLLALPNEAGSAAAGQ